ASDVCSDVVWSYSPDPAVLSNPCGATGAVEVTFRATDNCGNFSETTASFTIVDDTNPTALCQNITIILDSDGNASIDGEDIDAGSSDACSEVSLVASPASFDCDDVGENIVTLTVTDECDNSSSCTAIVTVENAPTTSTLSIDPTSQQYSDEVTFTVTITDGWTTCTDAATSATFYVGDQEMGTALFVHDGSDLVATLEECLLEGIDGQMAPGTKTVSAIINGINPDFDVAQPEDVELEITQEDAFVEYNGQEYFSTPSPTDCNGTVTLTGYVEDDDDTPDGCRGDIRNALVTFYDLVLGGDVLGDPDLPVGLVNPDNEQQGIAITDFDYCLQGSDFSTGGHTFEVWAEATNYYTGSTEEATLVTLALPGNEFVTGGGHLVLENSAGTYAGTFGSKMNFGFNMKWNPSGHNLQGKINIIFRKLVSGVWKTYQIKSNKINSMAVDENDPNYRKAIISTKANLTDITNPANPISLGGNLSLAMNAWESTIEDNGSLDKIAVTLVAGGNGGGLLFSSYWQGSGTVAQIIDGGKIQVRSSGPPQNFTGRPEESETIVFGDQPIDATSTLSDEDVQRISEITTQPNPFDGLTTIQFGLSLKENVSLYVFNHMGQVVALLHNGTLEKGNHSFTFDGVNLPEGLYYYTL
ncbi:MAG TPA: hypothetical protein VGK46_12575, partial [Saprospiraceae bacterium]